MIELRGLAKAFDSKRVLDGITLSVEAGNVLGYIGPNGAGKTTTVKIVVGMIPSFDGEVRVCGFDVRRDVLEVKRRVGYVPESAALYDSLTAFEYLQFVGRLYGMEDSELTGKIRDLLALFDLSPSMNHRISSFSKGMRQKVLLGSALLHNPEVIFLDEPLSGLDANSTIMVKELIAGLARQGKTIFYCSHMMDVVERVCDRIVILDRGRVVADGTFEDLRAQRQEKSLERIFAGLTSAGGERERALEIIRLVTE